MGVPKLEKWCGCCNLKTGTTIIGIFYSVLAFMGLILFAAYAAHPNELVEEKYEKTLQAFMICLSVGSGLQFLFSMLLIYGVALDKPSFFVPWLIYNFICLVCHIISTFLGTVSELCQEQINIVLIMTYILAAILYSLIISYLLLVVHNYRKYLQRLNF